MPRSATIVHFLPGDFTLAKKNNLIPCYSQAGVLRVKNARRSAQLTSGEIAPHFPFNELLISISVQLPKGGAAAAYAQVKTPSGWSPWFNFGRYTKGRGGASAAQRQYGCGQMDVDLLKLTKKASALRYHINIMPGKGSPAVIRMAAACCTDTGAAYNARHAAAINTGFKPLKLTVPSYSQMSQRVPYARNICSPTALAMVLSQLGRPTSPLAAAARVMDAAANIYGNWFVNTAYAGTEGFYSFLTRLNSLQEARLFLAAGIPVVASVTFGPGELKNSPLEKTRGHLLVIKGFDAKGDVIVNDPAAPGKKTVERVYDRAQFAAAWLKNKYGTAYIIARSLNSFVAVKAPVSEFFSKPPGTGKKRRLKLIESQLITNERVELLATAGDWARVKALEQAHLQPDKKTLAPYEGWLPLKDLTFRLPCGHTSVVRVKTASFRGALYSMGVKLCAGGRRGALPAARNLNALPLAIGKDELRRRIIETARLFLGDKYYWGGRSAWGVDCSGLVNLTYRAWGLDLPRNASAQFAAARALRPASLKPADLIFTADCAHPRFISHVMLYSGSGSLIEATQDTNTVREVSCSKKFGVALKELKPGLRVNGKIVFFGTVLSAGKHK